MARRKKKREAEQAGFGEEQADVSERQRLTPVDVQQRVFRLAFRGYNEGDVDQFLDDVTETLAALHEENKRLREQLQEGGGTPTGATAAAQRQAEAIVRQAREEAARIAGGAEDGREAGAGAAGAAPPSFLVRERAFLQQIASLVQDHARSLKEEARRLREAPAAAREPGEIGSAAGGVAGVAAGAGMTGADASRPAEAEAIEDADVGDEGPAAEAAVEEAPPATAAEEGPARDADTSPEPAAVAGPDDVPRPEEATAPWRPAEQQAPQSPAWPGSSADDPLVSAWESAFASTSEGGTGEEEQEPDEPSPGSGGPDKRDKREEPSLRELFWGEE
jgi:DivIVA domain-containing protein